MKSTLEVLTEARARITRPENWTIKIRERSSERGVAYCALGAVYLAHSGNVWDGHELPAIRALAESCGEEFYAACLGETRYATSSYAVAQYNNSHSHEEVLDWFDRTIGRERECEREREACKRLRADLDASGTPYELVT